MRRVSFLPYIGSIGAVDINSCIDAGIRDALSVYSSYVHGKVVERSVWGSLVSFATDRANRRCGYSRGGPLL